MTREERGELAVRHTILMREKFNKEIEQCIKDTEFFDDIGSDSTKEYNPDIILDDITTSEAVKKYYTDDITILNFASFINPGGQFYSGSITQEEALCHDSFLYNVLTRFEKSFYSANRLDKNYPYYYNRALYSPKVLFFEKYPVNVITCAAPNMRANSEIVTNKNKEYIDILDSRIGFVFEIAAIHNIKNLVLGAFGCGVFRNDPKLVASIMKKYSKKYDIPQIIFAIPNKDSENYKAFKEIFNN